MKMLTLLVVVVVMAVHARALGGLTKTLLKTFMLRQFSLSCKCNDMSSMCELFKTDCGKGGMKFACPVTCGFCTACPPTEPPSLLPPVVPCDLSCRDRWMTSVCEYYKKQNLCPLYKEQCRTTCEECIGCNLPPNSPIPCSKDCDDIKDEQSCLFWNARGFCETSEQYNVRYVCQRTCGICKPCKD